ncbi:MAG: hypothetical protein Q4D19_08805 [Lautropia sp.]|nr:hypothetical protein [Lautropia sp.]
MNFIHRSRNGFPPSALTTLTLALMLAACGGGGGDGNNTTTSASSGTPTAHSGSSASTSSNTSASVTVNTQLPASNAADTPPPAAANNQPPAANNDATAPAARDAGSDAQTAASTIPQATLPTASVTNTPAEVPLISDKGVRGDVLLAMFEQRRCGASTTPSTTFDGAPLKSADTPPVRFSARLEASNYTVDPNDWSPADTFVVQECRREVYRPVSPGTYPYIINTDYQYGQIRARPLYGAPHIKRGFNSVHISYTLTVNDGSFEIGPNVTVKSKQDLGPTAPPETLQGGPAFRNNGPTDEPYFAPIDALSIDLKSEVSYGTIRQWDQRRMSAGKESYLRLMLIKSDVPNQAKLCSNVGVEYAKRLICTVWNIPQDWKWGQQLEYVDGYIVDDRTVYPNETGHLYWRNTIPR